MRDPRYDVLFESVRIGPKTMRNRFYQSHHCSGLGELPAAQARLRSTKAEGGWAVVSTEHVRISPAHDGAGLERQARLWDDIDIPNWALMCDEAHEHGALAAIQLGTVGPYATGYESRVPSPSTDGVADLHYGAPTYAMDKRDIRAVQDDYVTAACRARSAGFDIVNVHGAEMGSLPILFLMREFNQRTDEYGGPLRNRARFWLETLERVREAVGDDCAVAARFCVDTMHGEHSDRGVRVDVEGAEFITLADPLVDFWDLQVGGAISWVDPWVDLEDPATRGWMHDSGPSRFFGENFQGEIIRRAKQHTGKPVVGVGRFTSPDTMVDVVRSGQQDVIGAARPSIADPFLPLKVEQGRPDDIRECIGCNVCLSRVVSVGSIVCTQNPTLGEEYRRGWHPERVPAAAEPEQDVLVVGGGPSGLECALTLARRGLRNVHVVEARPQLGGHLEPITRLLPGLREWRRVIDWRLHQLAKLDNVTLLPGTSMTTSDILEYGAGVVVLATGSSWSTTGLNAVTRQPIPGADAASDWVLTPDQILCDGKPVPGRRVVVFDCEGYYLGASVAQLLASQGHAVHVVTPQQVVARYMHATGEARNLLPALVRAGVELHTHTHVCHAEPGTVTVRSVNAPHREQQLDTDALVLVTHREPVNVISQELDAYPERVSAEGIRAVLRVGDCVAPRMQVADAIFDGHRLAREIEDDNPMSPRPYNREMRFIGATDADYDAIREQR